jgi:hypothetical protein
VSQKRFTYQDSSSFLNRDSKQGQLHLADRLISALSCPCGEGFQLDKFYYKPKKHKKKGEHFYLLSDRRGIIVWGASKMEITWQEQKMSWRDFSLSLSTRLRPYRIPNPTSQEYMLKNSYASSIVWNTWPAFGWKIHFSPLADDSRRAFSTAP